jgi:hypothetical protein
MCTYDTTNVKFFDLQLMEIVYECTIIHIYMTIAHLMALKKNPIVALKHAHKDLTIAYLLLKIITIVP